MKRASVDEEDWLSAAFTGLVDKELLPNIDFNDENLLGGIQWRSEESLEDNNTTSSRAESATGATSASGMHATSHATAQLSYSADSFPENADLQVEAAEILAKELRNMTLKERESILQDVHGMAAPDEETEVFLEAKLDDMGTQLAIADEHTTEDMTAYNLAKKQNPSFTDDRKLRLQCLRCVCYNPVLAASRLAQLFQIKLELFGEDLLTEYITINDLSPKAQELMRDGRTQVIPKKDSSGRTLVAALGFTPDMFSTMTSAECYFYWWTSIFEDEEVQRTGIVGISALHDHSVALTEVQKDNYCKCALISSTLPGKIQGFHFLAARDPSLQTISNLLMLAFAQNTRHRYRVHYGTFEQSKMALMGFGIPVSALPFTNDGTIKLVEHKKWLNRRRKIDTAVLMQREIDRDRRRSSTQATTQVVDLTETPQHLQHPTQPLSFLTETSTASAPEGITPLDPDVLLGRGRPFQEHPGNMYLKKLVADWYTRYDEASRVEKSAMAKEIVTCVKRRNGRFLKQVTDGAWEEVSPLMARNKVSHGFRKKREMNKSESG